MQMYLCKNYDFSLVFFQASPCALQAFGTTFQVMFKRRLFTVYIMCLWKCEVHLGYKNNVLLSLYSNQNLTFEILLEPKWNLQETYFWVFFIFVFLNLNHSTKN
jgi:hypothetical protein